MNCPINKIKGRWERRKESRPQEVLAAALDLFVERGYAATRLDDVAAQAGVSKGTLYLYFANKEELFKAVVREHLLPLLGQAEQAIDHHAGHSSEVLRDLLSNWWEHVGETKLSGITKLIIAESGNFPEVAQFYHDEVMSRGNAMIARVLARGIARGELRKMDTAHTAQVISAAVIMLMLRKHAFAACEPEPASPPVYLNALVDLLLHGLLVPSQAVQCE